MSKRGSKQKETANLTQQEQKDVIDFIANNANSSIHKIATHFDIKVDDNDPKFIALKHMIATALEKELIIRGKHHSYSVSQTVGYIAAKYIAPTHPGAPARFTPLTWPKNSHHKKPASITLNKGRKSPLNPRNLKDGEHIIINVNTSRSKDRKKDIYFTATAIEHSNIEVTGVIEQTDKKGSPSFVIRPTDRKKNYQLPLTNEEALGFQDGDVVRFKLEDKFFNSQDSSPTILEVLGRKNDWKIISPLVASEFGLSPEFNEAVTAEMDKLADPQWTTANRTDLTSIPYITIDDVTTTDMDDAIFAKPTLNEKGKQTGWFISVAIADVAQYIPVGSQIDLEARRRGNTNYLPGLRCDMIPTEIATDKSSLVPNEKRSALAMHMNIDMEGRLKDYKLQRGIINSRAKLHHQQVENAMDGNVDAETAPILEHIKNIYAAYTPLAKQSKARQKLPIESKEQKICFSKEGEFQDIVLKDYMPINSVIEELMVLANQCAAKILKDKGYVAPHRNHKEPSEKRMEKHSVMLAELGYNLNPKDNPKGIRRQMINILETSKGKPEMELVHQLITMMQSRAEYTTDEETGHYGLALSDYAHFTSPIRRYADLVVHRMLISACGLGNDGLPKSTPRALIEDISSQISNRENLAKMAEREARSRFCAAWLENEMRDAMANDNKKTYEAIITDVTEAGLQVKLTKNGVEGTIPVEFLPGDARYKFVRELKLIISRFESKNQEHLNAYQQGARLNVHISTSDATLMKADFEPADFSKALLPKYENKADEIAAHVFGRGADKKTRKKDNQKTRSRKKHANRFG